MKAISITHPKLFATSMTKEYLDKLSIDNDHRINSFAVTELIQKCTIDKQVLLNALNAIDFGDCIQYCAPGAIDTEATKQTIIMEIKNRLSIE